MYRVRPNNSILRNTRKIQNPFIAFLILLVQLTPAFFVVFGCSEHTRIPSVEHLAEFENAGPTLPSLDLDRLIKAKIYVGPYRIVPGDMLELTMPAILDVVTVEQQVLPDGGRPYVCRVSENGTITLPLLGEIEVAGKSLAEIEFAVIEGYHPEYIVTHPSVVARVAEYRTATISITGAVTNPGIYELRNDQMSLVGLLMQAGGIVDEGAAVIRIIKSDEAIGNIERAGPRKITKQIFGGPIKQLSEPSYIKRAAYYADYSCPDEIEARLTFRPLAPASTVGRLFVRHERAIILTEELDITCEIQRQAALEKLACKEARISTAKVRQRLCALANLLKPGSGMYGSRNQPSRQLISLNPKFNISNPKYGSTSEITLCRQLTETQQDFTEVPDLELYPEMIRRANSVKPKKGGPIVLPVRGLNIPFADVALQDGDTIVVERIEPQIFTVVGLVNQPGNFPYPTDVKYNLMQALAFAGGLDRIADPYFVTLYRLKSDGTIINTTYKIVEGSKLTNALNTTIKPGDIVDVAQTDRTRRNIFLERVFGIHVGAYVPLFNEGRP